MLDQIFDIETVSLGRDVCERYYEPKDPPDITKPPKSAKTPEARAKWASEKMLKYEEEEAERREYILGRGALEACTGSVVCIGIDDGREYCPYVGEISAHTGLPKSERDVIEEWLASTRQTLRRGGRSIGHNNQGFDLKFIFQRCHILEIPCGDLLRAMRRGAYWRDDRVGDTMDDWLIGMRGMNYIKLDRLGAILGLGSKTSSGDKVATMTPAETAAYCLGDIRLTKSIAARMGMLHTNPAYAINHIDDDIPL